MKESRSKKKIVYSLNAYFKIKAGAANRVQSVYLLSLLL